MLSCNATYLKYLDEQQEDGDANNQRIQINIITSTNLDKGLCIVQYVGGFIHWKHHNMHLLGR